MAKENPSFDDEGNPAWLVTPFSPPKFYPDQTEDVKATPVIR